MFCWGNWICLSFIFVCVVAVDGSLAVQDAADGEPVRPSVDIGSSDALPQTTPLVLPDALKMSESQRVATIATAVQATVGVFGAQGQGGGSGVVISPDGYALTNYHVVQGSGPFMKCSMPDGVLYDAVIVGIDPTGDVALVKLLGRNDFPFATTADSDRVRVGDWCFAIGNPFLLATNFQPSVSMGIISGKNRYQYPAGTLLEYADCLQTDAAINPGNSGGALFDANGDLIGINGRGSFEKRGRVNVGVGYAISINQIQYFLDHLKSGRLVDHATLGATVESDSEGVVRISDVLPSSDAYRRGLRYDDVLVSFAGRPITTVNQFKNVLGILPKGYTVPVVYRRDDVETTVNVRLAGVHASGQLAEMIDGESGGIPGLPKIPGDEPDDDQSDGDPKPKSDQNGDGSDDRPRDSRNEKDNADDPNSASPDQRYRQMFVKRPGFTNYYFNRLNRDRIWQQFIDIGGRWDQQPGRWRISGHVRDDSVADEVPFQLFLGDQRSGIRIGDSSFVLDRNEDFSKQLVPPGSGGLLVALHLWRTMLIEEPAGYGDVYYFGSLPSKMTGVDQPNKITPGEALVDVLIGTRDVTETHFRFSPTRSLLQSLEMFPEIDSDPCRLEFTDYQRDGDLLVPRQIRHQHVSTTGAGAVERTLVIERIEFLKKRDDRSEP